VKRARPPRHVLPLIRKSRARLKADLNAVPVLTKIALGAALPRDVVPDTLQSSAHPLPRRRIFQAIGVPWAVRPKISSRFKVPNSDVLDRNDHPRQDRPQNVPGLPLVFRTRHFVPADIHVAVRHAVDLLVEVHLVEVHLGAVLPVEVPQNDPVVATDVVVDRGHKF
jgi:hypothetical protein